MSLPAPWLLTLIDPGAVEPAHLTGVVRTWGDWEIVLIHPLLGELKIPRSQIKSIAQAKTSAVEVKP